MTNPLRGRLSQHLGGAFAMALTACSTVVASGLDDVEASRTAQVLVAGGVAAEKLRDPGPGGIFRVEVPRADGPRATTLLQAAGLPKERQAALAGAFDASALVPSRTSEHARLVAGIEGELGRSLEMVDGVLTARVHLGWARPEPLADGAATPPSASVLLRHRAGGSPIGDAEVRTLVAAAVPGLTEDRVAVVRIPVRVDAPPPELVQVGPFTTTRSSAVRLRGALLLTALLNVALAASAIGVWARARRLRPRGVPEAR